MTASVSTGKRLQASSAAVAQPMKGRVWTSLEDHPDCQLLLLLVSGDAIRGGVNGALPDLLVIDSGLV